MAGPEDELQVFPTPLQSFKLARRVDQRRNSIQTEQNEQGFMLSPVSSLRSDELWDAPETPDERLNYALRVPSSDNNIYDSGLAPHQFSPRSPSIQSFRESPSIALTSEKRNRLQALFHAYDVDHSGLISPSELQKVLTDNYRILSFGKFNETTIRLIFSLFYKNKPRYTGDKRYMALNFQEFVKIMIYVEEWYKIYTQADWNQSNSIEYEEYLGCLKGVFGEDDYNRFFFKNCNIPTLNFKTFSNNNRSMSFDSFVESIVWIIQVINRFKPNMEYYDDDIAVFTLEEFLKSSIDLRY